MRDKYPKAFTLIEVLIAISIIGVLASIVLVSLNNSRTKSRDASAMSAITSLSKAVQTCLLSGRNLSLPGSPSVPTAGQPICAGGANWPSLDLPWSITNVWWETSIGYYWILASDGGGKFFICDFSPNSWGNNGVVGNFTYKCTKVGF